MQHDPAENTLVHNARLLEIQSINLEKFSPVDKYLIGDSEPMRTLKQLIEQVSSSKSTALITGESGTGKELVARAIHSLSDRSSKPFQAVNCGAFPESLLEDELFGHLKGSFTGAISNKKGLFAESSGGTIFLDELGEMPAAMQVKLLRVLQERKIRPLGSTECREIDVDIRVLAATNKDLRFEIENGRFRQDLFFRLNVFELHLPALRERSSDIPILAEHLLKKVVGNAGLSEPAKLCEDAISRLREYDWPGNVRELENVLERLSVTAGAGKVIVADLVSSAIGYGSRLRPINRISHLSYSINSNKSSRRRELDIYENVLHEVDGNYSEAARRLQMNRTTFYYRLKRLRTHSDGHICTGGLYES